MNEKILSSRNFGKHKGLLEPQIKKSVNSKGALYCIYIQNIPCDLILTHLEVMFDQSDPVVSLIN